LKLLKEHTDREKEKKNSLEASEDVAKEWKNKLAQTEKTLKGTIQSLEEQLGVLKVTLAAQEMDAKKQREEEAKFHQHLQSLTISLQNEKKNQQILFEQLTEKLRKETAEKATLLNELKQEQETRVSKKRIFFFHNWFFFFCNEQKKLEELAKKTQLGKEREKALEAELERSRKENSQLHSQMEALLKQTLQAICPLCNGLFPQNMIQAHADQCTG
jgi:DNA repair exonuclease SbcCD ATPase subunit